MKHFIQCNNCNNNKMKFIENGNAVNDKVEMKLCDGENAFISAACFPVIFLRFLCVLLSPPSISFPSPSALSPFRSLFIRTPLCYFVLPFMNPPQFSTFLCHFASISFTVIFYSPTLC